MRPEGGTWSQRRDAAQPGPGSDRNARCVVGRQCADPLPHIGQLEALGVAGGHDADAALVDLSDGSNEGSQVIGEADFLEACSQTSGSSRRRHGGGDGTRRIDGLRSPLIGLVA